MTSKHQRQVVSLVGLNNTISQILPQALSDMVESIIGAVYVSDNFAPIGVEALFDNVLKPFYDKHVTLKTLSHHPTKILFELFQARGCQQFEILKEKEDLNIRCYSEAIFPNVDLWAVFAHLSNQ